MKNWWKSRTIWAGITTMVLAVATLTDALPETIEDAFGLLQFFTGALTVYFRKTTKVGIGAVLADNRLTGMRT